MLRLIRPDRGGGPLQLAELMDGLAGRLRVPALGSEDDGSYAITFDGHLAVRCVPETDGDIRLVGVVGKPPEDRLARSAVLRRLLRAALARAHEPATLALDEHSGELILHRALPAGGDQAAFEQGLEDFVNRLAEWQRRLSAEAPPPPMMPPMMLMR
jgi:hypothetical protein